MDPQPINDTLSISEQLNQQATSDENVEKVRQVEQIIQSDRIAFEEWIALPDNKMNLAMPHAALRYLLIPSKILEFAQDPTKVDVLPLTQTKDEIEAIIVEHRSGSISDEQELLRYWEQERVRKEMSEKLVQQGIRRMIYVPQPSPDSIDDFQAAHPELYQNGPLQRSDLVTNTVIMRRQVNSPLASLYIDRYFDRNFLHNKGVARSFYSRLHDAATELGFRFITGGNSARNVGYFIEKLGRVPLSAIKPDKQALFHVDAASMNTDVFTIDFLVPEDKTEFLSKSQTTQE